jgi:mono/diheme cytochrome c family protein
MGGEQFLRDYGFPGNFYSRNITPYALKDWTDGEIYRTITEGVDRNERPFFPVMPYPHYASMDPEDVEAIIAYIRTLPAIKNEVKPSEPDFPFSLIIRTIPKKATPGKRPDPAQEIDYGGYLVNMAACFDCHTEFDKGKYNEAKAFAGGRVFPMPSGLVTSANITPDDETGIGAWSKEFFIGRFKSYADISKLPKIDPAKDMQTIMPWNMYAGMDSTDLAAIYTYLQTLKPIKNAVIKFKPNS